MTASSDLKHVVTYFIFNKQLEFKNINFRFNSKKKDFLKLNISFRLLFYFHCSFVQDGTMKVIQRTTATRQGVPVASIQRTTTTTDMVSQYTVDYCNYRHGVPVYRGLLQLHTRCPSIQRTTATTDTVSQYTEDY